MLLELGIVIAGLTIGGILMAAIRYWRGVL
jgi:hypothetical protein